MGTFVWWFIRSSEGEFASISHRKFDDFFRGALAVPAHDGFVRVVLVAGETEDRRAIGVRTFEFTKWRVDDRGLHDGDEALADAGRYMSRLHEHESSAREAGVLSATARIEKKRYLERSRWNPTERDAEALRAAINRRAKGEIV